MHNARPDPVLFSIGAKLAHKLHAETLKRYFSLLLFVMAAKLIWF